MLSLQYFYTVRVPPIKLCRQYSPDQLNRSFLPYFALIYLKKGSMDWNATHNITHKTLSYNMIIRGVFIYLGAFGWSSPVIFCVLSPSILTERSVSPPTKGQAFQTILAT